MFYPSMIRSALLISSISLVALTGCSGGSGSAVETNPDTTAPSSGPSYTGPAPSSDDVQNFKLNLWDNLADESRCGSCHNQSGQSPRFVRNDDINQAFTESAGLINLTNPGESRLVTKVASGHNCWLDSSTACAEIISNYIENWANSAGSLLTTINLVAPVIREIGQSKSFPSDSAAFSDLHTNYLTQYCADCHSDTSANPIQPYFASDDIDLAYQAAKSKINLDAPANSRFVTRLGSEFHNCWSNCSDNASDMASAIAAFSDSIDLAVVNPEFVTSKAMRIFDGIVASAGGRVEGNVIALWEFKTGQGPTAYDTSGVDPAINLQLSGSVEWLGSWGLQLTGGKAQGSTAASQKLYDVLTTSGEFSIEAWVAPANVSQEGPARIVSYSGGDNVRNFTLGQSQYNYDFLNRSSSTDGDGMPAVSTLDEEERLQATLQHVVLTYDPVRGRRIYVNGEDTGVTDDSGPGTLFDWNDTFAFVIGSETSGDNIWQGAVRMIAVHSRSLSEADILTNYDVGVGQKFYLLFSVAEHSGMADSYVLFEVQQFDNYGYLFNQPTFISLDQTATPSNITLRGMRIGVNGKEPEVGQAYAKIDTQITSSNYTPQSGQKLSDFGTIIALDKGADSDEFFLTFEQLGSDSYVRIDATPPAPTPSQAITDDQLLSSNIGIRQFAEVNAALSKLTTVPATTDSVATTFSQVQQQMPTSGNVEGFLAAHQMGITQLAVSYCNALVTNSTLRASYFPSLNFSNDADIEFPANNDSLIDPILAKTLVDVTPTLTSSPDAVAVKNELEQTGGLIDTMLNSCSPGCNSDDTRNIALATCAAITGSAVMLIH